MFYQMTSFKIGQWYVMVIGHFWGVKAGHDLTNWCQGVKNIIFEHVLMIDSKNITSESK